MEFNLVRRRKVTKQEQKWLNDKCLWEGHGDELFDFYRCKSEDALPKGLGAVPRDNDIWTKVAKENKARNLPGTTANEARTLA